ncbi:glycosyltransferase family 4 protein [Desulfurivibrio sp. C05AmB]|uniref:glycosyltransferase family 4 protein n=1 Tax=Desulfurivibrio sp. C05AmB TaxID=3374371 RepID=UPI00376F2AB0
MVAGKIVSPAAGEAERRLVVVQVLPELESGGVERYVLDLARALVRLGHESLVVSGGGRLVAQLEAAGSRHFTMPLGKKSPTTMAWILPLRRLLERNRVDILHLHSRMPAWIAYLAWQSLPAARRPRLVTSFHGFYSVNRYSAIMTKGEKVIAISRAIQEHVSAQYRVPASRLELIHGGVDSEIFAPAAVAPERPAALRAQWGLTGTEPVIMLPGRITRLKGHQIFCQALATIPELAWQAVCVGDLGENPDYAAELSRLTRELGISQRVHMVGHCADMPAALSLADLVVSATSSQAEAFGLVAVEAAAMNKAVIASAHGGSLETVVPGKTGWLVEPASVSGLATALREALGDPARLREFGINGGEWVRANFTVAIMTAKIMALYRQLLLPANPNRDRRQN